MDRQTRLDFMWLFLVALAFHAFWMLRLDHPSYFDAYYYTTNAQRLAAGAGFNEEIIWQYLDEPSGLPTPSLTYWMPLPAVVGAAGYRLFGGFRGAQLPFWLMAAMLPLISYTISWRLMRKRWQARAAAFFTMAGGYYAAYWIQPSTFVLFGFVGALTLLFLAWAQDSSYGSRQALLFWGLAGLFSGLGHLTRADGVLLLLIGLLLWLLDLLAHLFRRDGADGSLNTGSLAPYLQAPFALLLGYLLVMAPWFWRTWQLTGRPLSTVGTQTLFLTTYNDVFAYGRHFDLGSYLDWGWSNILLSKLEALWLAIQTFVVVSGLTAFSFFVVVAWLALGRCSRSARTCRFLRPFSWYTLLLYAVMSLVFTFPGQRGSLLHSSTAIWPWTMALVPAGLALSVDWVAARRPHWRPRTAKRLFVVTFVILTFLITFFVALDQPLLQEEALIYEEIAALLPEQTVVMTSDPPGFYYHTGLPAVVAPNDPPAVLLQAARQYGATYLLLDPDRPPPLAELYEGEEVLAEVELIQEFGDEDGFRLYRLHLGEQ